MRGCEIYKGTHHSAVLCRAVCSRWARAGPGTPPSNHCKAACRARRRSAAAHDTRYCHRLARLLLLQQRQTKL